MVEMSMLYDSLSERQKKQCFNRFVLFTGKDELMGLCRSMCRHDRTGTITDAMHKSIMHGLAFTETTENAANDVNEQYAAAQDTEEREPVVFENIPSDIVHYLANFMLFRDIISFEKVSRKTFVAVRRAPLYCLPSHILELYFRKYYEVKPHYLDTFRLSEQINISDFGNFRVEIEFGKELQWNGVRVLRIGGVIRIDEYALLANQLASMPRCLFILKQFAMADLSNVRSLYFGIAGLCMMSYSGEEERTGTIPPDSVDWRQDEVQEQYILGVFKKTVALEHLRLNCPKYNGGLLKVVANTLKSLHIGDEMNDTLRFHGCDFPRLETIVFAQAPTIHILESLANANTPVLNTVHLTARRGIRMQNEALDDALTSLLARVHTFTAVEASSAPFMWLLRILQRVCTRSPLAGQRTIIVKTRARRHQCIKLRTAAIKDWFYAASNYSGTISVEWIVIVPANTPELVRSRIGQTIGELRGEINKFVECSMCGKPHDDHVFHLSAAKKSANYLTTDSI